MANTLPGAPANQVPPEAKLTKTSGFTITEPGSVWDSLAVTGSILVKADNVTIRRSRIRGNVRQAGGASGLVLEDCDIDGGGKPGVGVAAGDFTIRRCDIHGWGDGAKINGNVVVEESSIFDLFQTSQSHNDGLQCMSGSNIVIRRNRIENLNHGNSCIFLSTSKGPISDVLIEDNLVNGGATTVFVSDKKRGHGPPQRVTVRRNRFGRDLLFRPNLCTQTVVWQDNVWADTGEAIPRKTKN
jgi:hypothetical protein